MKRLVPLAIVVVSLCIFLSNRRALPEIDCAAAPYMAWSLVRHGNYELQFYPYLEPFIGQPIRVRADGAWVSMRPPGSALAALPFIAPVALVRSEPIPPPSMHHVGKLAAAVYVALSAALFFVVCQRIAPAGAWPATLLFALGTSLYSVASQALWMHGPAICWLSLALYLLTANDSRSDRSRLLTGLALGFAALTRPTTAFFAVATLVCLPPERRRRGVVMMGLGGMLPLALLVHYNWVNFGDVVLGGYSNDKWSEPAPLWLGLTGLLIAPSRGLLVYSPALLLAIPGIWHLTRHGEMANHLRRLLIGWLVAALVSLVFFARWHDWQGGWSYGPRLLSELMPIGCIAFAVQYQHLKTVWPRRLALVLVALSIGVHGVGVFGRGGYEAWQLRHMVDDQGRHLFSVRDTQIEAHVRALLGDLTH